VSLGRHHHAAWLAGWPRVLRTGHLAATRRPAAAAGPNPATERVMVTRFEKRAGRGASRCSHRNPAVVYPGADADVRAGQARTVNTKATQVRPLSKINTAATRTKRHSPALGGTTATMSMTALQAAPMQVSWVDDRPW
jgi:hypothetical protein